MVFVLKEDKEIILHFSNIAELLRIASNFQDKNDYLIINKKERLVENKNIKPLPCYRKYFKHYL